MTAMTTMTKDAPETMIEWITEARAFIGELSARDDEIGHTARYLGAAAEVIVQLTGDHRDSVRGVCSEIGNDEMGMPRILIHANRDDIKNGPQLLFRHVRVYPVGV